MLYSPVPTIPAAELAGALLAALRAPGEQRTKFRELVRAYLGREAVDFCCARAALEHILRRLEVRRVVMPAFLCPELAEVLLKLGVRPVFVDVHRGTLNISPEGVQEVISRGDALLAVHAFGNPCQLTALAELASDAGAHLIEDCAHALGARYRGMPVGTFGRYSVFSMYKLLPTPSGGFLCASEGVDEPPGGAPALGHLLRLPYVTREVHPLLLRLRRGGSGRGYPTGRCSPVALSIFNRLFPRIEELTLRRRRFAEALASELSGYEVQKVERDARPSWQSLAVLLPEESSPPQVAAHLRRRGVVAHRTWHDTIILHPGMRRYAPGEYPVTLEVSRRILTLPVQPHYTHRDARAIAEAFEASLSA